MFNKMDNTFDKAEAINRLVALIVEYFITMNRTKMLCVYMPITVEDDNVKIKESADKQFELDKQIKNIFRELSEHEQIITVDDAIQLIEASDHNHNTFDYLVAGIEITNTKVTSELIETILFYATRIHMDIEQYKNLIYLMSKAVDTMSEYDGFKLASIAVQLIDN